MDPGLRPWGGVDGFRNVHPIARRPDRPDAPRPTLTEFLFGGTRRVPTGPLPSMDPREAWQRKPGSGLRATWLGHSTVLVEIDGLRAHRPGPARVAVPRGRPKRFQPVPVRSGELPPVDVVPVSHDHYDHRDHPPSAKARQRRRAVRHLARRRRAPRGLRRAARAHHRA